MVHSEGSKEDKSVQILKFIYTLTTCEQLKDTIMVCTMYSGAPLSLQKLNLHYHSIQESPAIIFPKEFTIVLSFCSIC